MVEVKKKSKTKKSAAKKVVDLPKKEKVKKPQKVMTGFSRPLGLFFIATIGILSGLLLFNLIVHFEFVDSFEDFELTSSQTDGNGSALQTNTYDEPQDRFDFTFDYAEDAQIVERLDDAKSGRRTLLVGSGTLAFTSDGQVLGNVVASFKESAESKDDTVTTLATTGTTTKEVTFAGTKATEITKADVQNKTIVFENAGSVYVLQLDTSEALATESEIVENSVELTKAE